MGRLLTKAIDPFQYDTGEPKWDQHGLGSSPTRQHFWEYIKPFSLNWRNKDIIDIGAGTGWLLDLAVKAGARLAVGVEPSKNNIQIAKKYYPKIKLINSTWEEFVTMQKFDVAIAVMSFVHIKDVDQGVKKVYDILSPGGEFVLIVPDFDYFGKPRFGYKIEREEINNEEYAVMVERPEASIADIIRTPQRYKEACLKAGFNFLENKPVFPTKVLLDAFPKYHQMKNTAMSQLLRFVK